MDCGCCGSQATHQRSTQGSVVQTPATASICLQAAAAHSQEDQPCQYCGRVAYNRHYFQCCVIFQAALLGLLQPEQHVDCQRTDQHVRTPDAQLGGGSPTTGIIGEENLLTDRGPEQKTQAGEESRASWAQETGGHRRDHHFDGTNRHPARGSGRAEPDGQGLHLFMEQTGPTGVLSNLYQAGVEWNQKRSKLQPLRTTLLMLMVMELVARLEKLQASKEDRIKCRQRGRSDAVPSMGSREETTDGIHRPGANDDRGLQSGNQLAGSCSAPTIRPCHATGRKLVLADYWHPGQAGYAAEVGSSSSATTTGVRDTRRPESELNAVQQQLLKQRLLNSSKHMLRQCLYHGDPVAGSGHGMAITP